MWCPACFAAAELEQFGRQGVHTYLHHVNVTDPTSPVESQLPHIAAFMLAQAENWYSSIQHWSDQWLQTSRDERQVFKMHLCSYWMEQVLLREHWMVG